MPPLVDLPEPDAQALPGTNGAVPMDTPQAMKENLDAFTESVHSKASTVIMWINGVEGMKTDRSNQLQCCTYHF